MAKRATYKITISYGYDIHSVMVSAEQCADILLGKVVKLKGQGFVHEEAGGVQDYWVFNEQNGRARFYLDNLAEFNGDIDPGGHP